ncbi:MAG TPA: TetR/AcrR family transcriptional regulator [Anaerolineales bacterium]|nr:TetR/AcrR family transcriptional regulator [Anaerolineales bacterium]
MPRSKIQSEQIRTESRQKILSTAQKLFAERGYDGCSVSDIARQAGMSQGNIYWYFSSKKELFKAVLVEGFEVLRKVMAEAAERPGTGIEKLDFFLEQFDLLMKEQDGEEFVAIIITLLGHGGIGRFEELGLSTHQIGAGYHQALNVIFAQGKVDGTIPTNVDPNLLSTFLFSFLNGLMLMYPDEWKDISPELIRGAVFRLLGIEKSQ